MKEPTKKSSEAGKNRTEGKVKERLEGTEWKRYKKGEKRLEGGKVAQIKDKRTRQME